MIGDGGETHTESDATAERTPSAFVYELGGDETPSEGVVVAVSAVANRTPTSLEPLYRSVDTDALDRLFDRRAGNADPRTLDLTFEYEGYTVNVTGDAEIRIGE